MLDSCDAFTHFHLSLTDSGSVYRKIETIQISGNNKSVPVNGAFCTGRFSYIWNSGYVLRSDTYSTYRATVTGYSESFILLRVNDPTQSACLNPHGSSGQDYQIDAAAGASAVELLNRYEYDLALYDLNTSTPTFHEITSQTFIYGGVAGGMGISSDYYKSYSAMHIIRLKVEKYFIQNAQFQGHMTFIYGVAAGGMGIFSDCAAWP